LQYIESEVDKFIISSFVHQTSRYMQKTGTTVQIRRLFQYGYCCTQTTSQLVKDNKLISAL
ncbi:5999_t:CDS:1, partial [Racocetra fulgida]